MCRADTSLFTHYHVSFFRVFRYTFSGLDGLDWASTISTLRAPNAPCHSPAPPTAEDSPGGPPKEDSPKQADLPQDSSPKAFFAPLSPHLPTQRSKTMPGAVERLTQVGLSRCFVLSLVPLLFATVWWLFVTSVNHSSSPDWPLSSFFPHEPKITLRVL